MREFIATIPFLKQILSELLQAGTSDVTQQSEST